MRITETNRLIIEKASLNDADFFHTLLNEPNWIKYIGNFNITSIEEAKNYIQTRLIDSYTNNGYGLYVMRLKKNNTPIGICGFVKRDYLDSADIGFAILSNYEGQGYSYEASISLMEYGRKELKLKPIFGITSSENIKSQKLLKKLGLRSVEKIIPNGSETALLLYSN